MYRVAGKSAAFKRRTQGLRRDRHVAAAVNGSRIKAATGSHKRYEYHRRYYAQNKEIVEKTKRRYRAKNSDKVRDYQRQYRTRNEDQIAEYQRGYRTEHKHRLKCKRCGIDPGAGLAPGAAP